MFRRSIGFAMALYQHSEKSNMAGNFPSMYISQAVQIGDWEGRVRTSDAKTLPYTLCSDIFALVRLTFRSEPIHQYKAE